MKRDLTSQVSELEFARTMKNISYWALPLSTTPLIYDLASSGKIQKPREVILPLLVAAGVYIARKIYQKVRSEQE